MRGRLLKTILLLGSIFVVFICFNPISRIYIADYLEKISLFLFRTISEKDLNDWYEKRDKYELLVVIESCLFLVITMMMYTHPVSSPHSISCLLPLLPVYYEGVAQLTGMTEISEVSILPEIHIYLTEIVFSNATIVIPDAQNLSCSDHELWSWF